MTNEGLCEETLDWKALMICILRKWRMLFIAALIGAVLFGGYKLADKPELVMPEEEREATQETIEENEKQIKTQQKQISDAKENIAMMQETREAYRIWYEDVMSNEQMDGELVTAAATLRDKIYSLDTAIQSSTRSIRDNEASIQELTEENRDLTKDMEEVESPDRRSLVKYAVLGGMLGVFLACVYIFLRYLLGRTLWDEMELKKQFGFQVLASVYDPVPAEKRNKRFWGDRLIDRLVGAAEPVDIEGQYAVAAAKIRVLAGGRPVLITGTVCKEQLEQVLEGVQTCLPEGMACAASENLLNVPGKVLELKDTAVVLVEAIQQSKLQELDRLVELLEIGGAEVIGAVAV